MDNWRVQQQTLGETSTYHCSTFSFLGNTKHFWKALESTKVAECHNLWKMMFLLHMENFILNVRFQRCQNVFRSLSNGLKVFLQKMFFQTPFKPSEKYLKTFVIWDAYLFPIYGKIYKSHVPVTNQMMLTSI